MHGDLATDYATALADGDASALDGMLADGASMFTPFGHWRGRAIGLAYQARAAAFTDRVVQEVIAGPARAAVVWQARLGDVEVRGCDVLSINRLGINRLGTNRLGIERIEVFVRPAEVLPAVHAAMTAAWPR